MRKISRRAVLAGLGAWFLHACMQQAQKLSGSASLGEAASPSMDLTPQQAPSHGDVAPSAQSPPTFYESSPSPGPLPTPNEPVVLDETSQAHATVSEVPTAYGEVLEEARAFRVQALSGSTLPPNGVEVRVYVNAANAENLTLYRSNNNDSDDTYRTHWIAEGQKVDVDAASGIARVRITDSRPSYLLAGRERFDVSADVGFATPTLPADQQGLVPIAGLSDDALPASPQPGIQALPPAFTEFSERKPFMAGKILLVLIHAAGAEHIIGNYQEPLVEFMRSRSVRRAVLKQQFVVLRFVYDSKKSCDVNARLLVRRIQEQYGVCTCVFLGDSMGGVIALIAHHLLETDELCEGVVTRGAPLNGSPLAVPKWVRAGLKIHPFPTLLYLAYCAVVNNFIGGLRSTRWIGDFVRSLNLLLFPEGLRSLTPPSGIPTLSFMTLFRLTSLVAIPVPETLSQDDDGYALPKVGSALVGLEGVSGIKERLRGGIPYINELQAAAQADFSPRSFLIPFAAHVGRDVVASAHAFIASIAQKDGLAALVKDTSVEATRRAFHWLATFFAFLPQPYDGREQANDGLVGVSSALWLMSGRSIETQESQFGQPQFDSAVLAQRLSSRVIRYEIVPECDHLQLIAGGRGDLDTTLFEKVIDALLFFADRAAAKRPRVLDAGDRIAMVGKLRRQFAWTERSDPDPRYSIVVEKEIVDPQFEIRQPGTVRVSCTIRGTRYRDFIGDYREDIGSFHQSCVASFGKEGTQWWFDEGSSSLGLEVAD